MPAAAFASAESLPCVVVAGWVIVDFTSPRLPVIEINLVLSITFQAPSRSPLTTKETIPPKPVCCLAASS